jgi:hypothetical protein
MKRRQLLVLPLAALALQAGARAVRAADAPEINVYLNPN